MLAEVDWFKQIKIDFGGRMLRVVAKAPNGSAPGRTQKAATPPDCDWGGGGVERARKRLNARALP